VHQLEKKSVASEDNLSFLCIGNGPKA